MVQNKHQRCEGKRRQWVRGTYKLARCKNKARGTIETQVGYSEIRHVCDDPDCFGSIARGYPTTYTPYPSEPRTT